MKFNKHDPCEQCPFRNDKPGFLRREFAAELIVSVEKHDAHFPCCQTTDFNDEGEAVSTDKTSHCAGALIYLEKHDNPNQLMRIAEQLESYDRRKLKMDSPVVDTTREFLDRHGK